MKKHELVRKLTAWTICLVMIVSLFAVSAFAAPPNTGTVICPCEGIACWMSPGVQGTPQIHVVNGVICNYTLWVGYQGLVCTTCGALLQEVPVAYESGHTCI